MTVEAAFARSPLSRFFVLWLAALVVGLAISLVVDPPTGKPPASLPPYVPLSSGFELGIAGWRSYGSGTLERVVGVRHTGQASAVAAASAPPGQYGLYADDATSARAGTAVRFSFWLKANRLAVGRTLRVVLSANDGIATKTFEAIAVTLSATWRRTAVAGRIPCSCTVDAYLYADTSIGVGEAFYVDDIRVRAEVPLGGRTA